jgi:hypothetical protein
MKITKSVTELDKDTLKGIIQFEETIENLSDFIKGDCRYNFTEQVKNRLIEEVADQLYKELRSKEVKFILASKLGGNH